MACVAIVGATGTVGGELGHRLAAAGHDVVGLVRPARLTTAGAELERASVDLRPLPQDPQAQPADTQAWEAALAGVDAVVNAAGAAAGPGLVDAVIAAGLGLVDLEPEQPPVLRTFDTRSDAARQAGAAVVPGAGLQHAVGDLLTAVAADAVELPAEAHIAYLFPGRRGMLHAASPGRRHSAAAVLGASVEGLVRGETVVELPGEARRLAWFPRPVGPSHAAGIGSGEVRSVPRHVPELRTVRAYLAVPTWRAELLQAAASLAGRPSLRRRLVRRLERDRPAPGPAVRAAARWGCVAEVEGADGIARAWAYGHDPYALSAAVAAALVEGVLARGELAGVLAPTEVLAARELLDAVSDRTDMRWSCTTTTAG